MKNVVALLVTSTIISSFGQNASDAPASRVLLKLSPQHFTQNMLKAGGEFFDKKFSHSVTLYINAMASGQDDTYADDYGYNGLGGELQYRKYISPIRLYTTKCAKEYFQGIYFAGFIQGGSYSADHYNAYNTLDTNGNPITVVEYDYHESVGNYAFGFTFGWQRTFWKVLYIDLYAGGGLQLSEYVVTGQLPQYYYYYGYGIADPAYEGILPKFGLQIGIGM